MLKEPPVLFLVQCVWSSTVHKICIFTVPILGMTGTKGSNGNEKGEQGMQGTQGATGDKARQEGKVHVHITHIYAYAQAHRRRK